MWNTNVGIGFGEIMTQPQYDELGEYYEPYGFTNDDNFKKTQPKDAIMILTGLKANGPLKSKINGNAYSRISSGLVKFLIKEQEAKSMLLSTKTGQDMSLDKRLARLAPHELTTRLFEEMANLRLKRTGVNSDIVLEPINSNFPDDMYYSFVYGLWRIKELEEEAQKKRRRRFGTSGNARRLTFFN